MDDLNETTAAETPEYREFTAEFDDFNDEPVDLSFHFKKPTPAQIERTMKEISKSVPRGLKNLCMATVLPDEREALKEAMKDHPGLSANFGNEILERLGFNALGK